MKQNIGILTRAEESWAVEELRKAILKKGLTPFIVKYRDIYVKLKDKIEIYAKGINILDKLDAIVVRPIGRVSLEKAIYRLDLLYILEENGVYVLNSPYCIEKAVDKFRTTYILLKNKFLSPLSIVSENPNLILNNLDIADDKYVVKPIFGSRGLGSTLIEDKDILWRILNTLSYYRNVSYIQEYLQHNYEDIRMFIVGDEIVASMVRRNPGKWKTNIAQGAYPISYKPSDKLKTLALDAAKLLNCEVGGIDILLHKEKPYILEINSQPGWRGLQKICKMNIAESIINYLTEKIRK